MTIGRIAPARLAIRLVLIAALGYALTAPGHLQTGDMRSELAVAQSLTAASFEVRPSLPDVFVPSVPGRGGHRYSKYGLGESILLLPAAVVGRLAGCPPDPASCPRSAQLATERAASLVNGLLAALALGLLFHLALDLGARARPAAALALVLGFATIHWDYAHDGFDVGAAAVFILAATLAVRRAAHRPGMIWPLLAGLGAGFALLLRIGDVLLVPVFATYLLLSLRREPSRAAAALALYALAIAFFLALTGAYDWVRFGTPLELGYHLSPDDQKFGNPLPAGLPGLLLSPGKSMFLYSPVLLAALAGWRSLFRRDRSFAALVASISVVTVVFYASYDTWSGDWAWGPRYMELLTPLLLLPLLPLLERWRTQPVLARLAVGGLVALGALTAFLGVCVEFVHQLVLEVLGGQAVFSAYWKPSQSALWHHLVALAGIIRGDAAYPEYSRAGDLATGLPPVTTIDFWWIYELIKGADPAPVLAAVVVLAGAAGWQALRLHRDLEELG
ncbi:MAG: hypothetical protein NVS9B1_17270 [Candidatus Dormibacteraceae bacterium]